MVHGIPPAPLVPFVRAYEGYVEHGIAPLRRRELPSTVFPVIVNFGPGFRMIDSETLRPTSEPRSGFVAGLHQRYTVVDSTGASRCLQFNLSPAGARRLFRRPLNELADSVVDLADMPEFGVERLSAQLAEAADWETRFLIVDRWLAAHLEVGGDGYGELDWAVGTLIDSAGQVPIARLCEATGWSRKRLAHRFREQVGVTPKRFARLVRFERVVDDLRHGRIDSWADLAAATGYADQSHLIRDFRVFAGDSPVAFARRRFVDGGGWSGT